MKFNYHGDVIHEDESLSVEEEPDEYEEMDKVRRVIQSTQHDQRRPGQDRVHKPCNQERIIY